MNERYVMTKQNGVVDTNTTELEVTYNCAVCYDCDMILRMIRVHFVMVCSL